MREDCPCKFDCKTNTERIHKLWIFMGLYNQETKKLYSNSDLSLSEDDGSHKEQSYAHAEGVGCILDCLDLAKNYPVLYKIASETARKIKDIKVESSF